jgi:opacity protein-like surface antigen
VKRLSVLLIAALVVLVAASLAAAQTGEWDLTWSTIDGGGAITPSRGGDFALAGTIGQPDAGTLSGGVYTLYGGFWGADSRGPYAIYLPLIQR